ncbi:MAG: hypothetical protein K0U98_20430 [Deltaproteobacteria bacterium]|nr:hypothetical protein [Deltaproteobacteria bacterium]
MSKKIFSAFLALGLALVLIPELSSTPTPNCGPEQILYFDPSTSDRGTSLDPDGGS